MMWIYLILFAVLVIAVLMICKCGKKEGFESTVVGGTSAMKMTFNDHSTDLLQLLGNNGRTIVLIHESPFTMKVWLPLLMYAQQLASSGQQIPTIIVYDLIGHGTGWTAVDSKYNDTNVNNYAWSLDSLVEHLHQIYETVKESGKITVVGYGVGGTIAEAFALKYPTLVDALYALSTSIAPLNTTNDISHLSNWIAANPNLTYLTMDQQFVQFKLCQWFENNNVMQCPHVENINDTKNESDSMEFLLAQQMFREASSQSFLQMRKLLAAVDMRKAWESKTVSFPVVFLTGDKDAAVDNGLMPTDVKIVRDATSGTNGSFKLYLVNGKHGFTLVHPEYIYKLITGTDMTNSSLTVDVL